MLLTVDAFLDCLLSVLSFCDDVSKKSANMLLVIFNQKLHMFRADFWFEKLSPETHKLSNLRLCHLGYLAYAIHDLWPNKLTNKIA